MNESLQTLLPPNYSVSLFSLNVQYLSLSFPGLHFYALEICKLPILLTKSEMDMVVRIIFPEELSVH